MQTENTTKPLQKQTHPPSGTEPPILRHYRNALGLARGSFWLR